MWREKAEEKVHVYSEVQRMKKSTCCLHCWPLPRRGTRWELEGRTSFQGRVWATGGCGTMEAAESWAGFLETRPHPKAQPLKAVPVSGSVWSEVCWWKTKSRRLNRAAEWHAWEWEVHALQVSEIVSSLTSIQPVLSMRNCVSSQLAQVSPTYLFFH